MYIYENCIINNEILIMVHVEINIDIKVPVEIVFKIITRELILKAIKNFVGFLKSRENLDYIMNLYY